MGSYERNKGRRRELQWAKYTGGKRANDEGLPGLDVVSPPLGIFPPIEKWEVKSLGKLPVGLKKWLDQMEREGADAVAFCEDRGEWYMLMKAERLDR